ncbi:MAG: DUF1592 domain-containing protein [Rhodopirellula sp.]|nr:DUF1592 domain-containing protein [Rhodopirellula sp.]
MLRVALIIAVCLTAIFTTNAVHAAVVSFEKEIVPLLQKYCVKCHQGEKPKGEFDLTHFKTVEQIKKSREEWRNVLLVVSEEEMPPAEPLPTAAERQKLVDWLTDVTKIDWSKVKNPGHVTIPRLTRDEYNNTMRDLLGVDLRPGARFSEDGEGNSGFNTDRDALFVTPAQLEKYFEAAERALDSLIALRHDPMQRQLESEAMFMTETKEVPQKFGDDFLGFVINRGQMTLYESVNFPADGYYEFRIRARSTAGPTGTRLRINDVTQGDIIVPSATPDECAFTTFVAKGSHQIAWNIEVPGAAQVQQALERLKQQKQPQPSESASAEGEPVSSVAPQQETETAKRREYTKLPANANSIINVESARNHPRYPAKGDEPPEIVALIKTVDGAALDLQRPFEWLRLHGPNGEPSQLDRFTGYIEERVQTYDKAKLALAAALQITDEEFNKRYGNVERLADNKRLLDQVAATVAEFRKIRKQPDPAKEKQKPGSVHIDWVRITGPVVPPTMTAADAVQLSGQPGSRIFIVEPGHGISESEAAQRIIENFVRLAFRHPAERSDLERFVSLYEKSQQQGSNFEQSLKLALTAVLVSPKFLYRLELGPGDDEFQLDEYQLASRLSYFLWMSMPDDELFKLAGQGKLKHTDVVQQQIGRLLADPRSAAFATAFTGQWLGFAALGESVMPDEKKFPQFTPELATAMKQETALVFGNLLKENRSLLELLDSEETWLNAGLAQHYGIKGVRGDEFVRVSLKDRTRGGLLGMGSILTATSSPTRTSPVVRGKWVLETLLGRTLPEPPADAGELPGDAGEARTLREELALHRRNPTCAACHDKIDPIGFGLGNFDAIGRFREKHAGKPIDAKGELPGGITFDGPVELKAYLVAERKTEFTRNLTRRLLSFALGRELQYFDEPSIEKIVNAVEAANYSSRELLNQIVLSYPFQYQTGRLPSEAVATD